MLHCILTGATQGKLIRPTYLLNLLASCLPGSQCALNLSDVTLCQHRLPLVRIGLALEVNGKPVLRVQCKGGGFNCWQERAVQQSVVLESGWLVAQSMRRAIPEDQSQLRMGPHPFPELCACAPGVGSSG